MPPIRTLRARDGGPHRRPPAGVPPVASIVHSPGGTIEGFNEFDKFGIARLPGSGASRKGRTLSAVRCVFDAWRSRLSSLYGRGASAKVSAE